MSIPYSMMNDEIKSFDHYMTYLALSTNTKKKKDVVPRKKRSFTVTDNILPDPNEAVKLAESISLTEAKHQEKEHRLHETHARLVIESELNLKAKEAPKELVEEALDHSKKLKGIETLFAGSGIILEVLDDCIGNNLSAGEEEPVVDQDGTEQAGGVQANVQVPETTVPNPYSSLTLSSAEYGFDDAIVKGDIDPIKVLKKRRHDDKDKDPSADSEKGKKKRRRKDSEPSKYKDTAGSLKKGKAPSQPSKTDKTVNADETIQEAAMESEEPVQDNDVNAEEQSKDDAAPKRDNSIWFKQDVNWFNELVNAEKDPVIFDDLMGSTIDFTKLAKNCLKKDKITKANLEGLAFKLLKGTCRNNIKLEYNLEQCYLALSDQLDWANLIGNKEMKYASSLTKTKAARYELKGIEDMIPKLQSSTKDAYDKNATF
ncbi:hypothetical protein Tco_0497707 [Tanacetum coccineum]